MSQETKRAPDITKNSSREAPREQIGEPRVVKGTQLETKGKSRGPKGNPNGPQGMQNHSCGAPVGG